MTFLVSLLDNVPYLKVGTLKIDHGVPCFSAAKYSNGGMLVLIRYGGWVGNGEAETKAREGE